MGRRIVEVATPALALRRAEAAASLGLSVETFDAEVRPHVGVVRIGGVLVWRVAELDRWAAAQQDTPMVEQLRSVA